MFNLKPHLHDLGYPIQLTRVDELSHLCHWGNLAGGTTFLFINYLARLTEAT